MATYGLVEDAGLIPLLMGRSPWRRFSIDWIRPTRDFCGCWRRRLMLSGRWASPFILVSLIVMGSPAGASPVQGVPLVNEIVPDPSEYIFIINGTSDDVASFIEDRMDEIQAALAPFIPPGSPVCIDGGAWDPNNPAYVEENLRLIYVSLPSVNQENPTRPSSAVFLFVHPNMDGECLDPESP